MTPEPELATYRIANIDRPLTPALAIYADVVDQNISAMVRLLGDVNRWRPHIKTAKLAFTIRRLVEHGVRTMKCATTLELLTACEVGANDVTLAYPMVGPAVARVLDISKKFPTTMVSALVENASQVELWRGSKVGLFLDINSGMNRTGIDPQSTDEIIRTAKAVTSAGLHFRGLHYYEGHHKEPDIAERTTAAHLGYNQLLVILAALRNSGLAVEEVITSGTPALPCALAFAGFRSENFLHRVSPGTVVYNDSTSLSQLPSEYGLRPAALVITTVVSRPDERLVTCDAGHKTVSLDNGVPNCYVLGHHELHPLQPSEEHLPLELEQLQEPPQIGDRMYLVPRHVCPTVNNFDHALIITGGRITAVEPVTARGREMPMRAWMSTSGK